MEKLQNLVRVSEHAYEPIPDPEIVLRSVSEDTDEEHERRRQERDSKLLDFYEQRKSRLLKLAVPVLIVVMVFVCALALSNSSWINPYYSNPYGSSSNDVGSNENSYHITRSSKDTATESTTTSTAIIGIMEAAAPKSPSLVCGVSCPDNIVQDTCSVMDSSHPVMGGLDMVQYFSFPDESYTGEIGSSDYQVQYQGYTFYFLNAANAKQFENNPGRYAPMWGGFCSYGMSAEMCPDYYWSANCLGPAGNWGIWTIQQDHLFFFYLEEVKTKFLENPDKYIMDGSLRWKTWFPVSTTTPSASDVPVGGSNGGIVTGVFNTDCYFTVAGQKHDGLAKTTADAAGVGAGLGLSESIEKEAANNISENSVTIDTSSPVDESASTVPDAKVIVAMDIFESSRMQP